MCLIKDGESEVKSFTSNRGTKYEAKITYEIIDNKNLKLRAGDVVRFSEYTKAKYKQGQFAVILKRYKKIKDAPWKRYVDYGAEFIMLTGPKKGEIKKKLFTYDRSPDKFI